APDRTRAGAGGDRASAAAGRQDRRTRRARRVRLRPGARPRLERAGAGAPMTLRIEAHARLHLGFLDPAAGENSRRFGGLGFALETPRFVLSVAKAEGLRVEGPHAERVEVIAERVHRLLELKPRAHIVIEEAIPEH